MGPGASHLRLYYGADGAGESDCADYWPAYRPWFINKLRELSFGQHIREEGPQSHRKKAGTPTMGGLLIVASIVIPTLLWADLSNPYIWLALLGLGRVRHHRLF